MTVGCYHENYASRRNIIGKIQHLAYKKVYDVNKAVAWLAIKSNKALRRPFFDAEDRLGRFNDFNLNRIDILHFFNTISFGRTPWITTFETVVPRFKSTLARHHGQAPSFAPLRHDEQILCALDALSSDACKKLIALSGCNLAMQQEFLRVFPGYRSAIAPKLTQLHPPQAVLVDRFDSKRLDLDGPLRFVFIGSLFFRKGGMEMLEGFRDLRKRKHNHFKLTIVSALEPEPSLTERDRDDVRRVKAFIEANSDWIAYYQRLPNHQVLEVMRKSHVGLLPTYADTYGYAVLEFQAAGCPVISTNVRALPEINNCAIGWLIDVPKNHLGEAVYTTREDRLCMSASIKQGLESAVLEIFENRQMIAQKANAALAKIRTQHSLDAYAKRLGEIYHQALE